MADEAKKDEVTAEVERPGLAAKLTDRDRDLLGALVLTRGLTAAQVHRLAFEGKNLSVPYRRLAKLAHASRNQAAFLRQVLQEAKVETKALKAFLQTLEKSRVVLETCSEAFVVADMANAAGHEVSVVPATMAPSLGVGQRGVKTDKKDAQNLSLASCRMERLARRPDRK